MVEPEFLDSKEVLSHLNSLGYCNVSPQQLKEFLHDLKKLIKYDQKRNSNLGCHCCCETQESTLSSSDRPHESVYDDSNLSTEDSYGTSASSWEYSSECSSKSLEKPTNIKGRKKNHLYISNAYDRVQMKKIQPSFIRPWQISAHRDLSCKSKKNLDPVSLYHSYKVLWKHQKIPGETKHSQLRWVVRSRMLGQEPQPRVIH